MKESDVSEKIIQILNEFETLDRINPSSAWSMSLMTRLASAKQNSQSIYLTGKFIIVVLLFVAINTGLILKEVAGRSNQSLDRNSDLKIISNELLINPVSINN